MTAWDGRKVVVVGLGASGFAAARALLRIGAHVRVTEASDKPEVRQRAERLRAEGAEVETGGHDPGAVDADVAVVSPGIPPHAGIVQALSARGIEIVAEIELASQLAHCDLLAVTGTNGKTTTVSMLAAMLTESGIPALAAGNIGLPLVDAVASLPPQGAVAAEVSSFQLATSTSFRPHIAVVLNVAEDHTDWHGSFASYARAKARITLNQTRDDVLVYNARDRHARTIASDSRARTVPFDASGVSPEGVGVAEKAIVWRGRVVGRVADLVSRSRGTLEDALAASAAALEYGASEEAVVRALRAFKPLPHRLDAFAELDGVGYIDDSKATNPHATLSAVQGLQDVVLIAGGRAKGMDLSALSATVPPVRAVVALGESADEVAAVFERLVPVTTVRSMHEAVEAARARSVRGGSVLLSPGCASLDMYEDYAARGDDFRRVVLALEPRSREDEP